MNSSIRIQGTVDSLSELSAVEVIRNGESVTTIDVQAELTEARTWRATIDTSVELNGSGWVAVRCFEKLPNAKVSFAHTNPVFVDVAGYPLKPRRRDAEYFLQRMEEEIARNSGVLTAEAVAEYEAARQIYAELLEIAIDAR